MVQLTVYGGAGEIGGNKILLEDGPCGVLLDFGISYARRKLFFEEYLKPRTAAGLTDLIVTGVLPRVPGLYRRDLLRMDDCDLPLHDEPIAGAVLLSHAHLDHAGHITFLDERVPIYCSALCHRTLQAMQDSRPRDFEGEITGFRHRPAFPDEQAATPRPFREIDGEFTAAGFRCRTLPVDHSMLGCLAFLVHTTRGNVLYTGDLRFHGPEAHLSERMLEEAARAGVWMLITEGTRIDVTERRTEHHVLDECLEAVRATAGPVVADFAPRDLYRLATFVRVAQQTGRSLVVLPQDALLLDRLRGYHPLVPNPKTAPMLVLKERKKTGTFAEGDYARWERPVLRWPTARSAAELRADADRLIFALSFWDVQNLIDLGVGPGALHIYSASEPHDEEQAIDFDRLGNWLSLLGVTRRVNSHASGHAAQPDLVRMVRTLRPEVLVAIHTERAGLWRDLVPEVQVVEPRPDEPMTW
jgi:ribonuclease J